MIASRHMWVRVHSYYLLMGAVALIAALLMSGPAAGTAAETGTAPASITAANASTTGPAESVRTGLSEAAGYLSFGQFADALQTFRGVLDVDRMNLDAMIGVALCHDKLGRQQLAIAEFRDALFRHRDSATAVMGYLDCARRAGRIHEAMVIVKQLFRPQPTEAASAHWRIAEWMVNKDYWYAQYFAQRAHALDPVRYPASKIEGKGTQLKTNWTVRIPVPAPVDALPNLPEPDEG